jgi:hypothetical protein
VETELTFWPHFEGKAKVTVPCCAACKVAFPWGRVDLGHLAAEHIDCGFARGERQMNNLLRLLVIAGLAAGAIVMVALGLQRHNADLLAPVNLMLFVAGVLVYLLPTGLAMYRDCKSTGWIVAVNLLLGWTIFGWFVAMGWAAGGKIREPVHPTGAPPVQPVPGN